ncbi:hypothetical protein GLOIN_2v1480840 [Rhizophagus irregularis DAOM 181602=DAOM 197198]|uniref:Transposase domain-containing protein n=2 Tax=Rhizophagus irregularis TaxID=588596 RepID=A0A015K7P0_RHIIW|nr:hypothetical protein RirG_151640 [Rhizophagus irregularis DAOM 197198w]GBC19809.2 hypothetical protein GLOIN_2v1480840 [Rhizophagus irregularis DAOM 181602=DAOM 197198]
MSTKIRNKLPCYCKTCNGKIVDERTKKSHEELETQLAFNVSGFVLSANMNMLLSNPEPNMTPSQQLIAMEIDKPIIEGSSRKEIGSEQESSGDDNYEADFEHYARQRQDRFQELDANQCDENSNDDESTKSIVSSENDRDSDDEIQFTAPDFDDDTKFEYSDTTIDYADSWILIWIFKYQSRFRLSDVSIDVLIKFFRQVLEDANRTRFADFPSSLYVAKKLFKFNKCSKIFTACTNCHTLYNTAGNPVEQY